MPYNKNNVHQCDENKVNIKECVKSLSEIYDKNDLREIMDFYLFHPLILKNDNQKSDFGQKHLKQYGWSGCSGQKSLSALERKMLKAASLEKFCILKSSKISETINAMGLEGEKICIVHPRAVIKQSVNINIQEDGQVKVIAKENRMVCLFRHLRNSIAHNCTYDLNNGNVIFDDYDEKNLSARILIPKQALLEWKKIIIKN